jgi:hypothetical protein
MLFFFNLPSPAIYDSGFLLNLTKDISNRIFLRVCGNKPGFVWNMDIGQQRKVKVTIFAYRKSAKERTRAKFCFVLFFK